MPISSQWTIPVPECSLPTWLFNSPNGPLDDPHKRLLVDVEHPGTAYLTRDGFRLWSKRFAVGLKKAGLRPGDRVLLFSGNNLFFPVIFMGIVMAGGIFTGANPTYVSRELAYQLTDSDAKFLICADGCLDTGLEAASMIGMDRSRIFLFDHEVLDGTGKSRSGVQNWNTLIVNSDEAAGFVWKEPANSRDATCCINYSSGTTGFPKGVEITHYNYIANAEQVLYLSTLRPDREEFLQTERWLALLPMYHAYGQTFFVSIAPKLGVPVFIMRKYNFEQALAHIENFRITSLSVAPPIANSFAKHPAVKNFDISSIRGIGSGAAALSPSIASEVDKLFPAGQVTTKQGWGMTETTCSVMGWNPTSQPIATSIGQLLPNCQACIMSDDDQSPREVPKGQRGELWVRGPNIMKGYWRKSAETTATTAPGGWLKTGDIAYVDEMDRFFIVDRKKELIKVKGNQVAPAELESVLLSHPDIVDAAVIGVEIKGSEMPRAYLVRRQNRQLSGEEICNWMNTQVARHKRITGGVVFLDSVPKNPSGKILRKELRERAKFELRQNTPVARL